MGTMMVCIIAAHVVQPQAAPPDERETYVLTLKKGEIYYGYIEDPTADPIVIDFDMKFPGPRPRNTYRQEEIESWAPEARYSRRERKEKELDDLGQEEVTTTGGVKMTVPRDELELAKRASEMARETNQRQALPPAWWQDVEPAPGSDEGVDVPAPEAKPGFLSQWGLHAVILVGMLAAVAVIAYATLRE